MFTSRSLPISSITFFTILSLATALPQDPAVVTEVQVVTAFVDGQGAGLGAVQTTIAATEGVTEQAGGIVVGITEPNGGPPDVVGGPAQITPAPNVLPSSTTDSGAPGCDDKCSIYFQYVSAYFWPTENTNNTACLAGVTAEANGPIPTDLTPAYPSNYLVFPTISAGNACTRVGNIYYHQTIAFAPGAISTIEANTGATKVFNFADMPCPPQEVADANSWFYNPSVNPGRPYSPMIAPPAELFNLDPAFSNCVAAVYQGFDPPRAFPTTWINRNPGGGWWGRRKRSAPGHNIPRGPVQTAAPWT